MSVHIFVNGQSASCKGIECGVRYGVTAPHNDGTFHFKQASRELQNTPALPLRLVFEPTAPVYDF